MVNVVTTFNNFARGKIDHDMMGRFDLPLYTTSVDLFENFFSNFKGNAIYRTGFQDMIGAFQDCVFQEFKFRNDQNYILLFFENKIRFLTFDAEGNFGFVESAPSVPLEVTTPYTLEEARALRFTQNSDVTVITHQSHPPKDLTRVSANDFTLANHPFTPADPFGGNEFPKACLFYQARLWFANTPSKPTTFWFSEIGLFDQFTIPTETLPTSAIESSVSAINQPIEWMFGAENSLLMGTANGIVAVNGGGVNTAIEVATVDAKLTSADGSNESIPFGKDGLAFYVGKNNRNVHYFNYDILIESFQARDANFLSYDITKTGLGKIRHKKDRNDLIYAVRGDGALLTLNFNESENIIGWSDHKTSGFIQDIAVITNNEGDPQLFALVIREGIFFIERLSEHIEFSERVNFFTNDEDADDEAYNRKVAQELTECGYLDNSLRFDNLQVGNTITFAEGGNSAFSPAFSPAFGSGFGQGIITASLPIFSTGSAYSSAFSPAFGTASDAISDVGKHISFKTITGYESGRFEITNVKSSTVVDVNVLQTPTSNTHDDWYLSFDTVSGLTQYIGQTIGIVADGGFLGLFDIVSDTVDLDRPVLSVVVGLPYQGVIKSFTLGFQLQADNTQTTPKVINRVGMRTVASAGGKFGTSLYNLEPVQQLSQNDLNYLPPLPLDGTKYITLADDNDIEKHFYVVQNEPLPFVLVAIMIDANYSLLRS